MKRKGTPAESPPVSKKAKPAGKSPTKSDLSKLDPKTPTKNAGFSFSTPQAVATPVKRTKFGDNRGSVLTTPVSTNVKQNQSMSTPTGAVFSSTKTKGILKSGTKGSNSSYMGSPARSVR